MGQYYCGTILNKESFDNKEIKVAKAISPYSVKNGAKLTEHSWVGNWYVKLYERLLANEYKGYPLVWAGDYAKPKFDKLVYDEAWDFIRSFIANKAKELGLHPNTDRNNWFKEYYKVDDEGEIIYISENTLDDIIPYEDIEEDTYAFIINYDKKQFVRIPKDDPDTWTAHPLPLLCADGNGQGGGDYWGKNYTKVGYWAYDRIGVADELPEDIKTELIITFNEDEPRELNDFSFKEIE